MVFEKHYYKTYSLKGYAYYGHFCCVFNKRGSSLVFLEDFAPYSRLFNYSSLPKDPHLIFFEDTLSTFIPSSRLLESQE
jgi:hypothetical protein